MKKIIKILIVIVISLTKNCFTSLQLPHSFNENLWDEFKSYRNGHEFYEYSKISFRIFDKQVMLWQEKEIADVFYVHDYNTDKKRLEDKLADMKVQARWAFLRLGYEEVQHRSEYANVMKKEEVFNQALRDDFALIERDMAEIEEKQKNDPERNVYLNSEGLQKGSDKIFTDFFDLIIRPEDDLDPNEIAALVFFQALVASYIQVDTINSFSDMLGKITGYRLYILSLGIFFRWYSSLINGEIISSDHNTFIEFININKKRGDEYAESYFDIILNKLRLDRYKYRTNIKETAIDPILNLISPKLEIVPEKIEEPKKIKPETPPEMIEQQALRKQELELKEQQGLKELKKRRELQKQKITERQLERLVGVGILSVIIYLLYKRKEIPGWWQSLKGFRFSRISQ